MNPEGARAEDLCAALLRAAGLTLLERNWRCRLGEIDLIAEERGTLVFAEVRMRGPGGEVSAYPVNDRSAFVGIHEGDQVHVAMNQAVAVGVMPVRR